MGFFEPDGVNGREVGGDGLPGVAGIFADPEGAGGGAEDEALAGFIDVEGVAEDEIVGVFLGEAPRERGEGFAAIGGAVDDDFAGGGNAFFIFHGGDEPGGVRIFRMCGDGKAEDGGLDVGDFGPTGGAVGGTEDAVVMLDPESVWLCGALRDQVRILDVGVVCALGRHVFSAHAFAAGIPGASAVAGDPCAAARDAENNMVRIAGIDADGMNAGKIRAAAEPFFALRSIPK